MWNLKTLIAVSFLLFFSKGAESAEAAQPPHIVLVYVDDMGYNDVSWHNSQVHMPTVASLASEGVILEQAYAQQVCTPSRAALLTGFYPIHNGMQDGVLGPAQASGLPLSFTLLPQYLEQVANYKNYLVGKWHLGYCNTSYTPLERGFDSHYGFYNAGVGYYAHLITDRQEVGMDYRNETVLNREATGRYTTTDFTDAAIEKLQNHDPSDPMFLYMAYNAPHTPYQVNSSYLSYYPQIPAGPRQTYLAMITALDDQILRLVTALKEYGFWENTVFVFYSDNGGQIAGPVAGNNYPLRGGKNSLFEGGNRVPAFVTSNLLSNSGYVHNGMFHVTDLFATFIYLANNKDVDAIPAGIDGMNIWEAISDREASPRVSLVYNVKSQPGLIHQAAVRDSVFKLVEGDAGGQDTLADWKTPAENSTDVIGSIKNYQSITINEYEYYLFNLKNDPYETNNLATSDPENFQRLLKVLQQAKSTAVEPIDDTTSPDASPSLNGGAWSPGFC